MHIIGITGGSGAGKSEVCRILGEKGIPVFDADREYAKIASPGSPCVHEIAEAFGPDLMAPDGSLRRRELSEIVFAEGAEAKRAKLNAITHRYVTQACRAWLQACRGRGESIAVIDAPLLIESGLDRLCDRVVAVSADRQTRTERIMRRDGIGAERAEARIDAQPDDDFYRERCDIVIENGGDADLSASVSALLNTVADGKGVHGNSARDGSKENGSAERQPGGEGSGNKEPDGAARRGILSRYPLPKKTPLRIAIAAVLIILAALALINLIARSPGLIDNVTHPILYSELIDEYSGEYGVPPEIVCAVIETESSFRADAVSDAGATGLMQITEQTFWWLLSRAGEDMSADELFRPEINIRYGTYFLSLLYEEFGDWDTVYAAYNAGRSRVHRWLEDPAVTKDGHLENIPIAETAEYVVKVRKSAERYADIWAKQKAEQTQ